MIILYFLFLVVLGFIFLFSTLFFYHFMFETIWELSYLKIFIYFLITIFLLGLGILFLIKSLNVTRTKDFIDFFSSFKEYMSSPYLF